MHRNSLSPSVWHPEPTVAPRTCAPGRGRRPCACPPTPPAVDLSPSSQLSEVRQHRGFGVVRRHIAQQTQQEYLAQRSTRTGPSCCITVAMTQALRACSGLLSEQVTPGFPFCTRRLFDELLRLSRAGGDILLHSARLESMLLTTVFDALVLYHNRDVHVSFSVLGCGSSMSLPSARLNHQHLSFVALEL